MFCGHNHSVSSSPPHRTGRPDFPHPALGGCLPVCFMISSRQHGAASDTGRIFSSVVHGYVRGHIVLGFWHVSSTAIVRLSLPRTIARELAPDAEPRIRMICSTLCFFFVAVLRVYRRTNFSACPVFGAQTTLRRRHLFIQAQKIKGEYHRQEFSARSALCMKKESRRV